MEPSILVVENLKTWFYSGDSIVRAVDGINFSIAQNQTFALLGESGCGKSVSALSIMRLLPAQARIASGSVQLRGEELLDLPESQMRQVRGKRIAMIFQEPMTSLNPVMTVGEQISETLKQYAALSGAALHQRVLQLLNDVGIPDANRVYKEYPFQLSGGMKQRVMIAVALACEPELLIADEPTTALDVTTQAQILTLLRSLQQQKGMSILLITHDLGVVSQMAHQIGVMYAGELVEIASHEAFFSNPQHPYSKKLFASLPSLDKRGKRLGAIEGSVPPLDAEISGCRFVDRCDLALDICKADRPSWSEASPQHSVRCHLVQKNLSQNQARELSAEALVAVDNAAGDMRADTLLRVSHLKVHFPIRKGLLKRVSGAVKAVDDISFEIKTGKTFALVGESGCGKTTVGKGVLQLVKPTSGSIKFADQELTELRGESLRERRSDFQIIFQDPYSSLNPRMKIVDILAEGMIALGKATTEQQRQSRIDELLNNVGLSPAIKYRYPHEFSGGQRQRVAIARALAVDPKLIICDEPTSALDVSVQAQILNLFKSLQDTLGLTYLFITHNISVVEYLAQEVAVMYLGRIVEHGPVEDVLTTPKHPYTQALLASVPLIDGENDDRGAANNLKGEIPSPVNPPAGCHFHPRCPYVMPVCKSKFPESIMTDETRRVACYLYHPDVVKEKGSEKLADVKSF